MHILLECSVEISLIFHCSYESSEVQLVEHCTDKGHKFKSCPRPYLFLGLVTISFIEYITTRFICLFDFISVKILQTQTAKKHTNNERRAQSGVHEWDTRSHALFFFFF